MLPDNTYMPQWTGSVHSSAQDYSLCDQLEILPFFQNTFRPLYSHNDRKMDDFNWNSDRVTVKFPLVETNLAA